MQRLDRHNASYVDMAAAACPGVFMHDVDSRIDSLKAIVDIGQEFTAILGKADVASHLLE